MDLSRVKDFVRSSLDDDMLQLDLIHSGLNSESAHIKTTKGNHYFIKSHIPRTDDEMNRTDQEFKNMKFLWMHGSRQIPEPKFSNSHLGLSVYEWIDGRRFRPEEVNAQFIDKILLFLKNIQSLQPKALEACVPIAKEACFSIHEHCRRVNHRIDDLMKVNQPLLNDWMIHSIQPLWKDVQSWIQDQCEGEGYDIYQILDIRRRILSPSDVGFHNILKETHGEKIWLIDFEYFGWDDPVKLMSDFVLAPEIKLPKSMQDYFIESFSRMMNFESKDYFRFRITYPILAMKWSLILLNVFLPKNAEIIRLKNINLETQLEKSKDQYKIVSNYLSKPIRLESI